MRELIVNGVPMRDPQGQWRPDYTRSSVLSTITRATPSNEQVGYDGVDSSGPAAFGSAQETLVLNLEGTSPQNYQQLLESLQSLLSGKSYDVLSAPRKTPLAGGGTSRTGRVFAGTTTNEALNARPSAARVGGTVEVSRNRAVNPAPSTSVTTSSVEVFRNRIANPSFEVSTSGVGTGSQVTASRATTNSGSVVPAFGSAFMVLTGSSTPDADQSFAFQWVEGVNPGDFVATAARVRRSGSGVMFVRIRIEFYNDTTYISMTEGGWQALSQDALSSETTRFALTSGAAPTGTTRARMTLSFAKTSAGGVGDAGWAAHTDAWQASTGATEAAASAMVASYYDGAISPDTQLVPSWTGTSGLSASILTGRVASGWGVGGNTLGYLVTDGGTPAIEVSNSASNTPYVYAGAINAGPSTLTVGRWVALGVDVKPLNPQAAISLRLLLRTQAGSTNLDSVYLPFTGTVGTWQRVVHAIPLTQAGADNIDAFVWPSTLPAGLHYRARRSVVIYGDTEEEVRRLAGTYFDGGESPGSPMTTAWAGSAHNSETILSAPVPFDWAQSSGNIRYLDMLGGQPAVAVKNNGFNGSSNVVAVDSLYVPVGKWVAFGVNVLTYDSLAASKMRASVINNSGATATGNVHNGQPVTPGVETRITHARQVTAAPAGSFFRLVAFPEGVTPGIVWYSRYAVGVIADTEAEALAGVASFFDGDSPESEGYTYSWTGTPGASSSLKSPSSIRSARMRTIGSLAVERVNGQVGRITAILERPDAFWGSVGRFAMSQSVGVGTSTLDLTAGGVAGDSTAPLVDGLIRIKGVIAANGVVSIRDQGGTDRVLAVRAASLVTSSQYVLIDMRTLNARLVSTDTWDLTAGVDARGWIELSGDGGFTFQPEAGYSGFPIIPNRYYAQVNRTDANNSTIEVRVRRSYL